MNSPETENEFFRIAKELKLLSDKQIEDLKTQSVTRNMPVESLVLQKGLLNSVQVDIVETLLHPLDTIPGYEIVSLLGRGGMGVVYRAVQENLNRVVALKTVLVSQMTDIALLTRFEQEAQTVGRLRHPNIVAAYDLGQHDGRLFFAMEFVEGEDLDQLIARESALKEPIVWGIIRQAAAGLSHAAHEGIVHRDIKPANLLLVEPPEGFPLPAGMPMVKITDFGLALLASDVEAETRLTAVNTTLGSPHYMAPEQITGSTVDLRADIYALGATAWHLLAGKPPYDGLTLTQIVAQKATTECVPVNEVNPDVSAESAAFISKMMAKNPEDRTASYADVFRFIDRYLATLSQVYEMPTLSNFPEARPHVSTGNSRVSNLSTNEETLVGILGQEQKTAVPGTATEKLSTVQTDPAQPSPPENTKFKLSTMGKVGGVLIAGVILLGVMYLSGVFPSNPENLAEPTKRNLQPGSWMSPLFNGRNLSGWIISSGSWGKAEDHEQALVLAGSEGIIRRPLYKEDNTPLVHYRLQFVVRIHEAERVELHFSIPQSTANVSAQDRRVLRINAGEVQVGTLNGQKFEPLAEPMKLDGDPLELLHVQLERQQDGWWVLVNQRVVGKVGFVKIPQLPEIQLLVKEGPAWFSDLEVQELQAPEK